MTTSTNRRGRMKGAAEAYGGNVYELESFEPDVLQAIFRETIRSVLDMQLFAAEQRREAEEARRLSRPARALLKVLRREWEIGTADLRAESGVKDRASFTRALDELQASMIVVPADVVYQPTFTYIWTLGVGRFPDAMRRRTSRGTALREIARCFLAGAGMTFPPNHSTSPRTPCRWAMTSPDRHENMVKSIKKTANFIMSRTFWRRPLQRCRCILFLDYISYFFKLELYSQRWNICPGC